MLKPVTPELEEVGVLTVAAPETTDQLPLPVEGVLPARVAVVVLHRFWVPPGMEVVGGAAILIVMSSVELLQAPLEIVHLRVEEPRERPVTPEVEEDELLKPMLELPEITDQEPVPTEGAFAARVDVLILHKF